MNILVITREFPPHSLGGISRALYDIVDRLTDRHDITVLTGVCSESTDKGFSGKTPLEAEVHPIPFGTIRGHHVRYPFALRRFLQNHSLDRYDVAYAHTELPFHLDIPVVSHYHDSRRASRKYFTQGLSTKDQILDSIIDPLRKIVEQRSLSVSDFYIFNSKLNRDTWKENYRFSAPSEIVYNGADLDAFYPISGHEDYFLFVGGSYRKGLRRVREFAQSTDYTVKAVGSPSLQTDNINLLDHVSQPELRELYGRAKATIHPAEFEAFGNVVLESLACGTPVIVSDQVGAAEILTEETGIITTDLEAAVDQLPSCDRSKCRTLAEEFRWDRAVTEIERCLQCVSE